MSNSTHAIVTPKDYRALEDLLITSTRFEPWVERAVREKIRTTHIGFGGKVPADVITTQSRFRFQVDGLPMQERVLVRDPENYPRGTALCLGTLRGVALLGRAEGDEIIVRAGDRQERLLIEAVLFQPEANVHHVPLLTAEDLRARQGGGQVVEFARRPVGAPYWDGDDPGPQAA